MSTLLIISPLVYIEAGQDARSRGEFDTVSDPDSLYIAFVSYCEMMKGHIATEEMYNKRGEDVSQSFSIPFQLETFWLYANIQRAEWDALKGNPENVGICTLIEDAINSQQIEGALIGKYMAKIVTILQQRAEKVELSGSVAVEQITGIKVL